MRCFSLVLLAWLALGNAALAEQILIPIGQQDTGNLTLPQRGDSKLRVLEAHGLPWEEHKPVGQPPITRWDYAEFSVYFEHEQVINAVVHHRPQGSTGAVQP